MKLRRLSPVFGLLLSLLPLSSGMAREEAPLLSALAKMPVKEVTVFKDGNAFVLHEGRMPTDAQGNVVMDYLPAPVLGTFWPFATEKEMKLSAVTASQRRVAVERTPLSIQELIEANPGASVVVTEVPASTAQPPLSYPATLVGLTERSSQELEATALPNSGELLPQKGNVVLLKTAEGVKAVKLERIQDVTFKEPPKNACRNVEFRNLLTLKLDWGKRERERSAAVGLMYLQRGIRWIPEYKVTLDGKGNATVILQATLLNELTDLDDVTCNLVVGVPTFQFKNTTDPMALQQGFAQLSPYFREDGAVSGQRLSNAIMTQVALSPRDAAPPQADLGPEVSGTSQAEDLHLFTLQHVTLKKGARMVVPVSQWTIPYRDIYVLNLPVAPPMDAFQGFNEEQQAEVARALLSPKAMHKVRLKNTADVPFTTAPALLMSGERVLGQGLMTYTPKGGSVDLNVTAAVDIQVKKSESETKRTPNAIEWRGDDYVRVDLSGTITLTNYRAQAVDVEVVRHVLGNVTEAGNDGKIKMVNVLEDAGYEPAGGDAPWRKWWRFPNWWTHFNGVGRVEWQQKIEPGKSAEFPYAWHYFWR